MIKSTFTFFKLTRFCLELVGLWKSGLKAVILLR